MVMVLLAMDYADWRKEDVSGDERVSERVVVR